MTEQHAAAGSSPLEWLTSRRALRAAKAALPRDGSRTLELRRRARLACELSDRLCDPIDPLREGAATPLAIDLYRQSSYWIFCALNHGGALRAPAEVWEHALHAQLNRLLPAGESREALGKLFASTSFIELAELADAEQAKLLRDMRALAHDLLEIVEGPRRLLDKLLFRRLVRVGLFLLVLSASIGVGTANFERWRLGPNLAAGKPWRTSSVWAPCDTKLHRCGGLHTAIFFHTKDDASPWIEYDLRSRLRFSKVFVKNRDELQDRAVPLVIEVSDDAKTWHKVARRVETFRTWMAEFAPKTARYVRIRVDRRSWLHLEQVMVYR
jgi:hypothetical protein